jgi:type IV pilus assembly protein PilP
MGVVCFSGEGQAANEPDAVRYISNRIKIVRPEKISETAQPASPVVDSQEEEIKIAAKTGADAGKISEDKAETAMSEEVAALIGKKEQFYSRKGRVDPFEPFLRKPEPEVISDEDRLLERRTPLTPLEKIDLSQLKLTGVLRTPTKIKAMLQDSSGKGYIIGEGAYVGNKGGQVARILKDRVVVEEKFLDVFGKIAVRERELKLQQ